MKGMGAFKSHINGQWYVEEKQFNHFFKKKDFSHGALLLKNQGAQINRILKWIVKKEEQFGEIYKIDMEPKPRRRKFVVFIRGPKKAYAIKTLNTGDIHEAEGMCEKLKTLWYDCEKRGLGYCSTNELFTKFMKKKEDEGVAVKTYGKYQAVLDEFEKWLVENEVGDKSEQQCTKPAYEITPKDLEKYKSWLLKKNVPNGNNTIRGKLNLLRSVFNFGIVNDFMQTNPAKAIGLPKKKKPEVKPYTVEEIVKIRQGFAKQIQNAKTYEQRRNWLTYWNIVVHLMFTGKRVSDGLSTRDADFTPDNSMNVFKQRKTNKTTANEVSFEYRDEIQRLRQTCEHPNGFLFYRADGKLISYNNLYYALRKVLDDVGIKKESPTHGFRHMVANNLYMVTRDPLKVATQLGNTHKTTIDSYIKPPPTDAGELSAATPPLVKGFVDKPVPEGYEGIIINHGFFVEVKDDGSMEKVEHNDGWGINGNCPNWPIAFAGNTFGYGSNFDESDDELFGPGPFEEAKEVERKDEDSRFQRLSKRMQDFLTGKETDDE